MQSVHRPGPALCQRCESGLVPHSRAEPLSRETLRTIVDITPDRVHHVQEQIAILEADMEAADASIDMLESALSRVRQARASFEEARDRYRAMVAPVRRLHADVLAEMFLEGWGPKDRRRFRPMEVLQLGWICSQWRDVALATPGLWSDFTVDKWDPSSNRWLNPKLLKFVWLPRSADVSLHIEVFRSDKADSNNAIMQVLFSQSYRWRHGFVPEEYLYQPSRLHLPLLNSLHLSGPPRSFTGRCPPFADAPALREIICDRDIPDMKLPWSKLRTITILATLRPSKYIRYLKKCTRLRSLTASTASKRPQVARDQVHNSALKTWSLSCDPHSGKTILACVTAPALRKLGLRSACTSANIMNPPTFEHAPLVSFISRSQCALHRLLLGGINMTSEDLLEVLKAACTVEVLILEEAVKDHGTALFAGLTYPNPYSSGKGSLPMQNCILPILHTLHIQWHYTHEFDEDAMIVMVSSRLRDEYIGAPISGPHHSEDRMQCRKLQVLHMDVLYPSHILSAEFEDWRKAGLQVTFIFHFN